MLVGKNLKVWNDQNGHSELFWTTMVGKEWEKCGATKIGHFESFWTTLVIKNGKKNRMTKISIANEFTTEHAQ